MVQDVEMCIKSICENCGLHLKYDLLSSVLSFSKHILEEIQTSTTSKHTTVQTPDVSRTFLLP